MIDVRHEDLLIKAMTALDLAFVAWMRRRREAGRPVTRDEFEAVASKATALDNAEDVAGIGALVEEVNALDTAPPAAQDAWTWCGYWNLVLGASRDAADVVREFELDPTDRRELDVWLAEAALEAWREGNLGGPIPASWAGYHAKALDELCSVPVAPPAEYLATWASVAEEIITKGIAIGRTTARGNTMPVLAELVVHSCQRDTFGPDGDGVVLVDSGDGWRRLTDSETEAWSESLRDAWQGRASHE